MGPFIQHTRTVDPPTEEQALHERIMEDRHSGTARVTTDGSVICDCGWETVSSINDGVSAHDVYAEWLQHWDEGY